MSTESWEQMVRKACAKLKTGESAQFSVEDVDQDVVANISKALRTKGYGTYVSSGKLAVQKLLNKKTMIQRYRASAKRRITTTLEDLLAAHGMTITDLHRDRRYTKATGSEIIVLEPKGSGNSLHIVSAPPWLPSHDFGPIGARAAKRMGWWTDATDVK